MWYSINRGWNFDRGLKFALLDRTEQYDKSLLDIRPTPAEIIIKAYEGDYDIRDYVADIVQFLSCKEVVNVLHNIH